VVGVPGTRKKVRIRVRSSQQNGGKIDMPDSGKLPRAGLERNGKKGPNETKIGQNTTPTKTVP